MLPANAVTAHKVQEFRTIISGSHGINYLFLIHKWEGLPIIGDVHVLNNETQYVMGKYSLALFKRLVKRKAYNPLAFLNYLSDEKYQELIDWLTGIK